MFGDSTLVMKPQPEISGISELSIWGLSNYQELSPVRVHSLQHVDGDVFSGQIGADYLTTNYQLEKEYN